MFSGSNCAFEARRGISTAEFFDAYIRFCTHRGLPEVLYFGTNFTGAGKELALIKRQSRFPPQNV